MKSVILEVKILDDAGHVESTCIVPIINLYDWEGQRIQRKFQAAAECAVKLACPASDGEMDIL